MWNTLLMSWVNRNGDKPTITADSFNTVICCCSILNVSLQMRHTNRTTIHSDRRSPFSPPLLWHKRDHRTCREASECLKTTLTALHSPAWPQEGSWRRGWGWSLMWGKLTWCQAPGLSELHSGCLCAEPSSWAQGRSDATVLKVQQTASITT